MVSLFKMNQLRTIDVDDRAVAQEIMARAYTMLRNEPVDMTRPRPEAIGRAAMCIEASDAVTRAAHQIGVFAAREVHEGHWITAFNPFDALPSEDDPIICITWGQFNTSVYDKHVAEGGATGFFGIRGDIRELIHPRAYDDNYSSFSVRYREVSYAPRRESPTRDWLLTTPYDLVEGQYPVGEVDIDAFPDKTWDIF